MTRSDYSQRDPRARCFEPGRRACGSQMVSHGTLGSDAKLTNRFDDELVSYFSVSDADDCLGLIV